jgi:hypothetical protein
MKKSASKKEAVVTPEGIDTRKPVVKEYVDQDGEIIAFLQVRLPHVPYCTPKIIRVYESADKKELRFRINWCKQVQSDLSTTYLVASSQYVRILVKPGGYEIIP